MEGKGILKYYKGSIEITENVIYDYFYNTKRVSEYNTAGAFTGQRAEIEIIIQDKYFELNVHSDNAKIFDENGKIFKLVSSEPLAGFGLSATIFIGTLENAD